MDESRLYIEYMPLSALLKHPRNPKEHNIPLIEGSIERFGFTSPPIIDERSGLLTAGHGRLEALENLRESGAEPPSRIYAERGDWMIPVIRGVRFESDSEAAAYLITDNETTLQGGWSEEKLALILHQIKSEDESLLPVTGLGDERIRALLKQAGSDEPQPAAAPGDALSALKRAEQYRDKWGVQAGQVWRVGRHRLICGDNADMALRARLLAGVPAPSLAHLDPPYGINAVAGRTTLVAGLDNEDMGSTSNIARTHHGKSMMGSVGKHKSTHGSSMVGRFGGVQQGTQSRNAVLQSNIYPKIQGDDKPFDPTPLLNLAPHVVLWGANHYADKLPNSPGWIIWDKREAIVRNSFADCELAWTNAQRPARVFSHLWNGIHKASQHDERRSHPTEKPIDLFEYVGQDFAPGAVWLDLYGGSGAQLIAAERTGAICLMMEIEPLYVATTLERAKYHGIEDIEQMS